MTSSAEIGEEDEDKWSDFGNAESGQTLEFEAKMRLAVQVKYAFLKTVHLVSPTLTFTDPDGNSADFRYILVFSGTETAEEEEKKEATEEEEEESDEESLAFERAILVPLVPEVLLEYVQDSEADTWLRAFAAHWAIDYDADAVSQILVDIVAAEGESNSLVKSAVTALAYGKINSAVEPIQKIAGDRSKPHSLRYSAVEALGILGNKEATPFLVGLIDNEDDYLGELAIVALGEIKDPTAMDPLIDVIEHRSSGLAGTAGRALEKFADNSALPRLEGIVKSTRYGTSEEAMRVIGAIGSPEAVALLSGLYSEGSEYLREAICQSLDEAETPVALELLEKALQDNASAVRKAAVRAIGAKQTDERALALRMAMYNSENNIRISAIKKLGQWQDTVAEPEIVDIAEDKSIGTEVRRVAVEVLADYPEEKHLETLLGLVSDSDAEVRERVVYCLRKFDAKNSIDARLEALKDSVPDVRATAAGSLAEVEDERIGAALLEALLSETDENPISSDVNALISIEFKNLSAFPKIVELLRHPDRDAGRSINRLLRKMSDEDYELRWNATDEEVEALIAKWLAWLKKSR
jgi:HEAT repeat protein